MRLDRDHELLERYCERQQVTPDALLRALEEMLADGQPVLDPSVVGRAGEITRGWSLPEEP